MEHEKKHSPHKEAEVVVINDDGSEISESNKTRKNINHVCKGQHHKKKRKVKVETTNNKETLIVTQKVEVKKKKFKCVINLTNICEHKEKGSSSVLRKKSSVLKSSVKYLNRDRIVPQCKRNTCSTNKTRTRQSNTKLKQHRNNKGRSGHKERSKQKPKEERNDSKYLSPISSLSLDEGKNDLTYENISSESLDFYSDEELNTLIKRTRDRERKLSKTFEYLPPSTALPPPLCTSTPQYLENVSDVDNCTIRSGDMDISLQSLATLVLEPQLDMYSPTRPTGSSENDPECTLTLEDTIDYSPIKHTNSQMNQNLACDPITENMYLPSIPLLGNVKLETYCEIKQESVCSMPLSNSNLEAICNHIKTESSNNCEMPEIENDVWCSINGKSDIINNEKQFLGRSPKRLKLEKDESHSQSINSENTLLGCHKSSMLNCFGISPSSIKIENDLNDNILCQEVEFSQKYSILVKPEL